MILKRQESMSYTAKNPTFYWMKPQMVNVNQANSSVRRTDGKAK